MTSVRQPFHLSVAVAGALFFLATHAGLTAAKDGIRPDEIQFRRQAVIRLVFDSQQNIPLSSLRPAKIIDLDLMHPDEPSVILYLPCFFTQPSTTRSHG